MQTVRNLQDEAKFYDRMAKYLDERRRVEAPGTFHVSDLLSPRKWYWNQLNPQPFTRRELGFFLAGQAHHLIAEIIITDENGKREAVLEATRDNIKIIGTVDSLNAVPTEFKTNRKWTIPESPQQNYIDQLIMYCVLAKKDRGKIIVFFLTPGRSWDNSVSSEPQTICWDVMFSPDELAAAEKYMFETAKDMVTSIGAKDHLLLPLCEDWMCGSYLKKEKRVEIRCPHYENCRPEGRYPKEAMNANRH